MMYIDDLKTFIYNLPTHIRQEIITVYVYGSASRNDNDEYSDIDIFVCTKQCEQQTYDIIKDMFSRFAENGKFEFAFYQINNLEYMQKKGSYFLWHIKTEGVLVYESSKIFDVLLQNLPPYSGTNDDLDEYCDIIKDIKKSILQDDSTVKYELAVMATLARNICIACCYIIGTMDFGRTSPVIKVQQYFGEKFPFSIEEYTSLYKYRLHNVRDLQIDNLDGIVQYAEDWVKKIEILLTLVKRIEEQY